MALVQQNLGCQVLGSATESVGPGFNYLGETEIGKFEVTVLRDKQILRFEIPENNVLVVQVFKYKNNLRSIESA
jgi:hypothetical protein